MTKEEAIKILYEMEVKTSYSGELGGLAVNMAVEALRKLDMKELSIGEYRIPKGLVARISDGVLTVRESRQRLEVTEHRCRDCKHFGCGHATDSNWTTTVCFEKPKELKHKRIADKIYYHVGSMHKICSLFDLREGE